MNMRMQDKKGDEMIKIRKIIYAGLIMLLVLAMAACNNKAPADEDGQNPVMNYIGNYVCERADIQISADGDEGAEAIVTWGGSASSNSSWIMSGTFDEDTLTFEYHDCIRTNYEYDEEGNITSEEEVYVGGHGFIFFKEGDPLTLTWQDDQEHVADDMVFEYTGAAPEQ